MHVYVLTCTRREYLIFWLGLVRIFTSQPKCGVIVLYTDDVRSFYYPRVTYHVYTSVHTFPNWPRPSSICMYVPISKLVYLYLLTLQN